MNESTLRRWPWLLALAGVVIPLVGGGFSTWPLAVAWLVVLGIVRLVGRLPPTRSARLLVAGATLVLLFLLAFEGGWWLMPAVLVWLAIEVFASPGARETGPARSEIS